MAKILTAWNTGRLYARVGQRIAAEYDADKRIILFVDDSRMVDGVIEQAGRLETAREVQEVCMYRYDHLQYEAPNFEDRERIQQLYRYARENAPCL